MSKKTETIEIRVSPELKARLQEQSRDAGQTMSGFLRARIDADESGRAPMSKTGALTMTKMTKRIAVAGLPALAVAGIYALAVPAVAVANPDARVAFAEMDLNGDGVITLDEYQGLMMDQSELEALEGDDGSAESAEAEAEAEGALEIALPESCEAEIASLDLDPMELAELEMAALDINGDGGITFDELNGVMKREAAEEFLEMDIDGDGYLSAAELVDFDGGDDLGDAEEVLSDACIDALAEIMPEDAVIDGESMGDALADAGAEEAVAEEGTEEPMADEGVEELLADEGSLEEIEETFALGEDGVELDEDYMGRIIVAEYDTDGDGRVSLIEYLGD